MLELESARNEVLGGRPAYLHPFARNIRNNCSQEPIFACLVLPVDHFAGIPYSINKKNESGT